MARSDAEAEAGRTVPWSEARARLLAIQAELEAGANAIGRAAQRERHAVKNSKMRNQKRMGPKAVEAEVLATARDLAAALRKVGVVVDFRTGDLGPDLAAVDHPLPKAR